MTVVKNFLWNMGYQVFVLLLPIITIPYVSRVLGPTGIGINAYTNSVVQYFILFGIFDNGRRRYRVSYLYIFV